MQPLDLEFVRDAVYSLSELHVDTYNVLVEMIERSEDLFVVARRMSAVRNSGLRGAAIAEVFQSTCCKSDMDAWIKLVDREFGFNGVINVGMMKALLGNDQLSARALHQPNLEDVPSELRSVREYIQHPADK